MAGIKDIAKEAGVSISTVSYALNGSPKVTEETRSRILKIANRLGYVPNAAARMLKVKETKIIGVFLADYGGYFYGPLLRGMRQALNDKGYELIACSGVQSHRLLLEKVIDGGIILDQAFSDKELLDYAEKNYKMVVMDRELQHKNIKGVLINNKSGAQLAIKELLKNDVKKVYALTGPEGSYDSTKRMEGVREELSNYQDIEFIEIAGNFMKDSGEQAAKQIFTNYNEPSAIFCLNDEMAVGIYNYLQDTDYQVGKDVFIVGFDNIELAQYVSPRLSTISYSTFDWGSLAATNLLKLISNEVVENEIIEVSLTVGGSS
ncbi:MULTISPECIES: LacI family DNA-binding transcriptional regulator [unclassified Bacillus (in: firmicutes)]|uniref:LacI family DNA-binding transcriptional regulator n=1 Tax=Bacillaceae TaxID=186817 RepID=UPI000BEF38A4|nr:MULTISPECIES: LacI family DNA-binding transcriptional regulator [unclassified Bacillus (in: firmicutes)]PEJ59236.1 LacI family transcriptional regulator [Bacillus sp. AFS002410]PEL07769.1 LacI family transcriptional regulator [Bacillus sp. AFS017336]